MKMNEVLSTRVRIATLHILRVRGGVKGVELALAVSAQLFPTEFSGGDFIEFLDTMVKSGEVMEIRYVLPDTPDRVKSVYFPAKTIFTFPHRNGA